MRIGHGIAAAFAVLTGIVSTVSANPRPPFSTDYSVASRGANQTVSSRVTSVADSAGRTVYRTNLFTTLATGKHFWRDGQWHETKAEIELTANGAAATNGPHKVFFAPNLNTVGAVDLTTPDGKRLRSRILGLYYYDENELVMVAETKDSFGLLVGTNQVWYTNAFDDVRADVQYVYTKAGFAQNIILRAQPPAPADLGLNPETTRLQVLTEFFDAPVPQKKVAASVRTNQLANEFLNFGAMKMVNGRAFSVGEESESIRVAKQWVQVEGRSFLVEEVPLPPIQERLESLRRRGASVNPGRRGQGETMMAALKTMLPSRAESRPAASGKILLAQATVLEKSGFVLDYELVTSDDNFVFETGVTYLVDDVFNILLPTIQAGAVVKFQNGAALHFYEDIVCETDAYQPAIFTTIDDDSVGEILPGSTGIPTRISAGVTLNLSAEGGNFVLEHARFSHLSGAFRMVVGGTYAQTFVVRHAQFIDCAVALQKYSLEGADELVLQNVLVSGCDIFVAGFMGESEPGEVENYIRAEHVTVSDCNFLTWNDFGFTYAYLTNSLVVNVTNQHSSLAYSTDIITNHTATLDSGAGVFTAGGGGAHYLAGNTYRDAGTTAIDSALLTAIQGMTTHPPPESTLDSNPPDLGFHYPTLTDWDLDGMEDGWEIANGLNPFVNDAGDDPDGDWVTNLQEYNGGSNSTNPRDPMVIAWGDNSSGQCKVPLNLRNVIAIAAGDDFSVALKVDGSVEAWGANDFGQTNVPPDLTNAVAISANFIHSLALRDDATIAMWGTWWWGTNYYSLGQPAGLTNIIRLSAGANHDLAVRDTGNLAAWSPFISTPYTTIPTNVVSPVAIAAGYFHSVAALGNGTVSAWGEDVFNVLDVPAGLSNVVSLAAGDYHTLALKADGTVAAWGAGDSPTGFLWVDFEQSIVPSGLSNVVAIAASGYRSLALRSDGTIMGWGDNLFGQGTAPPGVTNLTAIAAGWQHTLGIRVGRQTPIILEHPANRYATTGEDVTFSSLGLGLAGVLYQWQFNGTNITHATNATLTLNNVSTNHEGSYRVIISTGAGSLTSAAATFTLVTPPVLISQTEPEFLWTTANLEVEVDGVLLNYRWSLNGTNLPGSLASQPYYNVPSFGSSAERLYAVAITNLAGYTNSHTWRVKSFAPGGVAAWGTNYDGELDWPASATNVIAVAAGKFHSVAVRENGHVLQWGYEWDDLPTDLTNIVAVAAGYAHTLALHEDGTLTTWGLDTYANSLPVDNFGIKAVAAGEYHNVAVLTNGNVIAWGLNGAVLGWHLTEVPADLTNATAVAAGTYHSLALRTDGTVVSWGHNLSGQTNVPVGLSNVVAIAAGERFSLALKTDGTVTAWGENVAGQCNVPAGLSNIMAIAAGWEHTVALKNDGTVVAWGDNSSGQTNVGTGLKGIKSIAAGGDHALAAVLQDSLNYPVEAARDLLLIYNTNSVESKFVKDYYLANRPMVADANVLGIGCTTNEMTSQADLTNTVFNPLLSWLAANPTKRPQYLLLFSRVPTLEATAPVDDSFLVGGIGYPGGTNGNVGLQIRYKLSPTWRPFVNYINFETTNDCVAYIDKLRNLGTNYSPGKLVISASAGGYANTNFYYDGISSGDNGLASGIAISNTLVGVGVPSGSIYYSTGADFLTNHITQATNVAAYFSNGGHSILKRAFATNGWVKFYEQSGWYIMTCYQSTGGHRYDYYFSTYIDWFRSNAFGGTNYENTPVAAVANTDECGCSPLPTPLFTAWVAGKYACIANWYAGGQTISVGDPLVKR